MDSLSRAKAVRCGAIAAFSCLLVLFVVVAALRNAPEPTAADLFVQDVLERPAARATAEEREELRRQWERFSPETRERVFTEIARARLDEIRGEVSELTPEQRQARIRTAIEDMRRHRGGLSPQERQQIQKRLQDPETQAMVRRFMAFYREELTARERAELDPLVQEWLIQVDHLGRGR
ncbi:MAG: hypothetical protein JXR77_14600 [Lentisphaeria bacterium]|nr:hypothetical protein [Lentisphaeria bacterium]